MIEESLETFSSTFEENHRIVDHRHRGISRNLLLYVQRKSSNCRPSSSRNLSKLNTHDPPCSKEIIQFSIIVIEESLKTFLRRKLSNCRLSLSRNLSKPSAPCSKEIIEFSIIVIEESLKTFSSTFEGNHRIVDHRHRRISRNFTRDPPRSNSKSSNSRGIFSRADEEGSRDL